MNTALAVPVHGLTGNATSIEPGPLDVPLLFTIAMPGALGAAHALAESAADARQNTKCFASAMP
jgi:hypothetical protein